MQELLNLYFERPVNNTSIDSNISGSDELILDINTKKRYSHSLILNTNSNSTSNSNSRRNSLKLHNLHRDEIKIMKGALSLSCRTVMEILTKVENTFMIESSQLIDCNLIQSIHNCGHSRIPIYENNFQDIVGILVVKV